MSNAERAPILEAIEISKNYGARLALDNVSLAVKPGEIAGLRDQLRQAEEAGKEKESLSAQIEELSRAVVERDQARREYAELREQFETVRQENARLSEKKPARPPYRDWLEMTGNPVGTGTDGNADLLSSAYELRARAHC